MPRFVSSVIYIVCLLLHSHMILAKPLMPALLNEEQPVLRLYTEHSPPGEYLDAQGRVVGATVELIELLLRRLDQPATIELLPWARAFELAQLQPNSGVFETVRNKERENLFKWVGPLKMHTIGLYGRSDTFKGSNISLAVNNKYLACVYRESVHVNALKRIGFTEGRNLILTVNHGDCFTLLLKGRVQLVVINEAGFNERQLQMQQSGHELVMVQPLIEVRMYLAFSLDNDDSSIARWQQMLEQSYLDGSMRALYQGIYKEEMISLLEQFAKERQSQLQH